MNDPLEPSGKVAHPRFRMDTGLDILEEWTADATEDEKDAVYGALFAMADRTLFRDYQVLDDGLELSEIFVLLPESLVLKVRVHCFDSFGIVYVGPRELAPGQPADEQDSGLAA
jgi:hypothetical protein